MSDNFDRPTQSFDSMSIEGLKDELSALDGGLEELTNRRAMVRKELTKRISYYKEQLQVSNERNNKMLTRGELDTGPTEDSGEVPYDRHNVKASGGRY